MRSGDHSKQVFLPSFRIPQVSVVLFSWRVVDYTTRRLFTHLRAPLSGCLGQQARVEFLSRDDDHRLLSPRDRRRRRHRRRDNNSRAFYFLARGALLLPKARFFRSQFSV
ncbi:hypothetical protein L596_020447 [Steinernema carpocapsae]|uniref:Uncharacterized protein n=1 Tax=Steinernema carpocapsae TaxID=34508 RepID=A0A4U5MTK2_STECR|nr:hypothetical protein L596_020447 [Steinernema carpocapsae]